MTQVNTEKLIAVEGDPDDDGTKITATPGGITVSGAVNGEYGISEVSAPWPAVLEHAPPAEMFAALVARGDVIKVKAPCFINGQHLVIIAPGETP